METDFIYWRHKTPAGIEVEEICGADDKPASVWLQLALQVYGENGKERFRIIDHTDSGAPLLEDSCQRISVSHTPHFLCIAQLPRTPEADLNVFNPRTAMGIDCEKSDREQVLKIRERFLSERELSSIPADNVEANVLAWTCKEAIYKAALTPGLDFRACIELKRLPAICDHPGPLRADAPSPFGEAVVIRADAPDIELTLYSYRSEGHIITLAYSPKCAKYKS
ncbi:MAG: 4'-phosphopantetheinyl transferase superfamily protein [Muribaculaceae bacterium]|nr:4'-phosphopantetheinyl transferase superfamily protein [Muribaculaceae bacterium]